MLLAGDEFAKTQRGNNNAYCQDNEISWLNWDLIEENRDFFEFYKNVIAFRKRHPAIRKELKNATCGFPSTAVYDRYGNMIHVDKEAGYVGVCFAGYRSRTGQDDIIYVAVNAFWEDTGIRLPSIRFSGVWQLNIDTADENSEYYKRTPQPVSGDYTVKARSICVFTGLYIAENLRRN